jgi:hypothetical protein
MAYWKFQSLTCSPRKIPWRLSKFQKARQRKRLRAIDTLVSVVDKALSKQGATTKAVERWKAEMPIEQEMVPKDKYTMFDRKEKKYRKGIHSECPEFSRMCANFNILKELQNYQNGPEFRNGSILLATDL